jgi:hypothetical protein
MLREIEKNPKLSNGKKLLGSGVVKLCMNEVLKDEYYVNYTN